MKDVNLPSVMDERAKQTAFTLERDTLRPLLPLPEPKGDVGAGGLDWTDEEMQDYARANVEATLSACAAPTQPPAACRHCGCANLTWESCMRNGSNVVEGRLRTNDVTCSFVLGCDDCSETLSIVSADEVAQMLGAPPQPATADRLRVIANEIDPRTGPSPRLWRDIADELRGLAERPRPDTTTPPRSSMDPPVEQQRDMLAQAIRDAAVKAGIARPDASMTGPMLLMLCEDLASAATSPAPDVAKCHASPSGKHSEARGTKGSGWCQWCSEEIVEARPPE